jgi:hydroxymethylglutaryl-CoA reductase
MAIEEPSVVAGASFMAKLARAGGGFSATTSEPLMIGQMQVINLVNLEEAKFKFTNTKPNCWPKPIPLTRS